MLGLGLETLHVCGYNEFRWMILCLFSHKVEIVKLKLFCRLITCGVCKVITKVISIATACLYERIHHTTAVAFILNRKRHHSQIVNISHRFEIYYFAKFVLSIHVAIRVFDEQLNKEIYLVDL